MTLEDGIRIHPLQCDKKPVRPSPLHVCPHRSISAMISLGKIATALVALASVSNALERFPESPIDRYERTHEPHLARRQSAGNPLTRLYPEYNLSVPIDHYHNETRYEPHADGTFPLRYWFDAQFYKPGGPVIVLSAGETSGVGRLPFLQKGIVYIMAKALGGVGVILEHRYYGTSVPTPDFSTENLRFLTTEQALADTAYFAQNVKFKGLEDYDLSPAATPWIAYGGSYAGAFVAFLRKVYPDVFWGAISSSGVPVAIWDYWKYFEAAAVYGPAACVETTQKLTHVVDTLLLGKAGDDPTSQKVKAAFGLEFVKESADFGSAIAGGIYGLQSYNWDPATSSSTDSFFQYCRNVSSDAVLYPATAAKRDAVRDIITEAGYGDELDVLETRMLNYIGYVNLTTVSRCTARDKSTCFDSYNPASYQSATLRDTWRLWQYQVCTEWGYLQTGSGVPEDQLPLISRLVDLEYSTIACREAFNLTGEADVANINKYGGFDISYPRLAFVDGEWDPWRAAGVNAIGQTVRNSTVDEPVFLMPEAVHHWDENGVFPNETIPGYFPPLSVSGTQMQMVNFVEVWLNEWKKL
ncbi:hypothetical protein MCOR17_001328 [Pyricularia oryzae]|nr:hypothetical protein MCOR17_001328 [Pyricularia oryzae]